MRIAAFILASLLACLAWGTGARADVDAPERRFGQLVVPPGADEPAPSDLPPANEEDPSDSSDREPEPEPELDDFVAPQHLLAPQPLLHLDPSYGREIRRGGLRGVSDSLERPPRR